MRNRWGTTVTIFMYLPIYFEGDRFTRLIVTFTWEGRTHQLNCDIWFKGGTDTPVWS